jgi:hypothetical protein
VITNIYPESGSTGIEPIIVSLAILVNTTAASTMNITFYSNLSGIWDYFYIGTLDTTFAYVKNGTYRISVPYFSRNSYTYYWYVNVSETTTGEYNQTAVFNFTTRQNVTASAGFDMTYIASAVGLIGLVGVVGLISYIIRRRKTQ